MIATALRAATPTLLALAAAAVLPASATAAPPASASVAKVRLSPSAAPPGVLVRMSGVEFTPSVRLSVRMGRRRLARARVSRGGRFRVRFRVPRRTPGIYKITVTAGRGLLRMRFHITRPPVASGRRAAGPTLAP
jgi:hypothetical protein